MNKRMNAAKNLEAEIRKAFLETHGLTLDDCDWKELMCDCREDYEEYSEWYLACYA